MERIILEIQARGLNQYHSIDNFPVTIGRAYDNDIILSDRSVSAHHIRIERTDYGNLFIHNLSSENGTMLDGEKVDEHPIEAKLSSTLLLGHVKLSLVSPSTSIEETHRHDCDNLFCLLGKPLWSALLLLASMAMIFLGHYIETPFDKDASYYFTLGFPYLLGILISTLFFSVISRVAVQRWYFLPIMSVFALLVLIPQVLLHIGHFLNYLFTSDTPQNLLVDLGYYVLPFVLIFLFLRTIYRSAVPLALGISIAISFFSALPYILDSVDNLSMDSDFSDIPIYNQTLSHLDERLDETISLDDFIKETKDVLQKEMETELEG